MPLRLKDLFFICQTVESILSWCIEKKLILDLKGNICANCSYGRFGLRKDSSFSRDGFVWRCSNKQCGKKVSIREGSWFEKHKLTLEQILCIIYFWIYKVDQEFVKHELGICNQTIVDWYNFCREVCDCILFEDSEKIGGIGKTVEIDESKFGKRKYHKGRRVDGQWVFGGIERESKKCFFAAVEDRTSKTLVKIIKDNIEPGTTIISDCWKAYDCLDKEGYEHLKVNHSVNFVDPETGAHTNTIESTWRALKRSLPKNGTLKSMYDSYFCQYCIRKKYINEASDPFLAFIELIVRIYNVNTKKTSLVTDTILPKISEEKTQLTAKRQRVVLGEIDLNNNSLDDFEI